MYYVTLYYQNAKLNQRGKFEVSPQNRSIPKWTILSSGNTTLELLRLITLSTADPRLLSNADLSLERFFKRKNTPLHLEFEIFHHPETEGRSSHQYLFVGSGLDFYQDEKQVRDFSSSGNRGEKFSSIPFFHTSAVDWTSIKMVKTSACLKENATSCRRAVFIGWQGIRKNQPNIFCWPMVAVFSP